MKQLTFTLFSLFFIFSLKSVAQINDCVGAEVVCSNDNLAFNPQGPGLNDFANPNNNEGCMVALEQNSAWYYFEIDAAAPPNLTLGFIISPNGGLGEDYDWALYGPNVECGNLGDPIRCSSSSAQCGFCPETGMGMGAMDTTEGPGTGDGFVSTLVVQPGQGFYLLIDNWLGTLNGFMLSWTGSASNFLDCDAMPPCALMADAGTDISGCQGATSLILNGTSSGNNGNESYSWIGTNGGTPFLSNPNIPNPTLNLPPNFNGTITYTLTVTEDACVADDEMVVTINPLPTVNINQAGPFCQNDPPVPLSANPGGGTWGGAVTGNQFNPMANGPGLHTVTYTYTDGNGCTNMESIQIEVFSNPSVSINPDPSEFCQNAGSVTLTATGNGGGGGYSYNWSTPAGPGSGPTYEASIAGQYTVSVTDTNGCTNTYNTNVTINPNPVVQIIEPGPICESENMVTLNAVPSGGTFTGSIVTPEGDIFPSTIPPGTYPVSYTYFDQNNCEGTDVADITITATPEAIPDNNSPLCQGQPILLFGQTNGTGTNISWWWSGPNGYTSNVQNPTNATVAGPYILQVTIDGCASEFEVTQVIQTQSPDALALNGGPYCPGQTIQLFGSTNASGNSITFQWSGPNGYFSTEQNPEDALQDGIYSLIITVDDCPSEMVTTDVTYNQAPDAEADNNGPYCQGNAIELTGNTNTSGNVVTYTWNGPNGYESFEQNPNDAFEAGIYELVIDVDGCTSDVESTEVIINAPPQPIITGTEAFCEGNSEIIDAGGGFQSYIWDDGSEDQILNVSASGTYSVTVTDVNGCSGEDEINITVNQNPSPNIAGSTTFCSGNTTTLDAGGPYDIYLWSDGSDSQTLSVGATGIYSVTVTNLNGCSGSDDIEVTESSSLNPIISGDTAFCSQNATLLDAGTGFFSYLWNDGSEEQTLEVTSPGDYSVIVSDNTGCSGEATVSIVENQLPDVSITGNVPFCVNSSIFLDAGTGFTTYAWSDQSLNQSLEVFDEGTYSVTVTDANGCTNEDVVTTVENENPEPIITGPDAYCAGETITIDAGIFVSYIWNDGTNNQTCPIAAPGVYSVTVTDINGCTGEDSYTVTENPLPEPAITGILNFCEGSSTIIQATPGFLIYEWSNGLQTTSIEVTAPGDYTVIVTDANGCTGSISANVEENPNPEPSISGSSTFCTDNSTTLDAGGGFDQYLWTGGNTNQTLQVSTEGTYAITVTDTNGCTGVDQLLVEESESLNPVITGGLAVCNGAASTLDAGPGFNTYFWSTGETTQTIEASAEQEYSVIVTDANGCSGDDSVFLEVFDNPSVNIMGDNFFCAGTSEDCDAGSGFSSYLWSDSSTNQIITVTSGGTYGVTVTDANGCTATDVMNIEELPNPTPTISGPSSFCSGNSATLTETAGYDNYSWSTGESTSSITVSDGGFYSLTVTNMYGCTGEVSQNVVENASLTPVISGEMEFCEGSSTILDAGAGFSTYEWSNGAISQTIEVSIDGNYGVVVTDSDGCSGSDNVSITVNSNPNVAIGGSTSYCIGGFSILDAGPGYDSYSWNNGFTTQTITVTSPGNYSVDVVNNNGCPGTASVNVQESTSLTPVITGNDAFCVNGNTILDAGTGFNTYLWSDGSITQTLLVDVTGDYSVTVSDTQGCSGETSISVDEVSPPSAALEANTEICNTEAGGSVLNLYNLILSGDMNGNWEDTDNSGAVGLFNNLNFNNIPAGVYNFTYTTNSAIDPCPESSYQVAVTILDCSCPDVLFFNADPLCNGEDMLDLTSIENTAEEGSWSIIQTPTGINPATLSGSILDATDGDPGDYILQFELINQAPPGCQSSYQVAVTIDPSVSAGVAEQPLAFCYNEQEVIQLNDMITGADPNGSWTETSANPSQGTAFDPANGTFENDFQQPGNYTFEYTVNSIGACPDETTEVTVVINELPAGFVNNFVVLNCTSPFETLEAGLTTPIPNYTISWTGPGILQDGNENSFNPNVDQAGIYILTITNTTTGCSSQAWTEVTSDEDPPVAFAGNDDSVTCNEPVVTLQAGGDIGSGFEIEWSGPAINAGNINDLSPQVDQPGLYSLSIINLDNGCVSEADTLIVFDETNAPDIAIQVPTNDLDCNNTSVSLTGSSVDSNVSFEWFDPDMISISNNEIASDIMTEGIYTLVVINNLTGCTDSETATVIDNTDYPTVNINTPSLLDCINTESSLDGTGSSTGSDIAYLWNGPLGGLTGSLDEIITEAALPGSYELIVSNTSNGCTASAQVLVEQDVDLPNIEVNNPDELDCTVSQVSLDGTGSDTGSGISYSWLDENSNEVSNLISFETENPGIYEFIVTDEGNGCSDSEYVTVSENTNFPSSALLNIEDPSCFGDNNGLIAIEEVYGGTSPYLFSLDGQALNSMSFYNNLASGAYELALEDANGCRWDTTIIIQEPILLEVNLGPDIELQLGDSTHIEAQINLPVNLIDTIIWSPEDLIKCDDPLCQEGVVNTFNTVTMSATVIDENGCRDSDELTIIMRKQRNVFIPTAFSPNGDGSNDIFLIFGNDGQIVNINKFLIFNRWGEVVHEALDFNPNDPNNGWDGNFKGERMNPGVFIYLAEIEFIDGVVRLYKGDVTLMK